MRACAHPTGLAGFTIRGMMCLRYEKWKATTRFPFFTLLAILYNGIWKIENNHEISIFHSVGCFVKKLNITVITTLETDWPQEATLSVGHQQLHWKVDSDICLRSKLEWPQSPLTGQIYRVWQVRS